jgi:hypothetical protein
MIGTYPLSAIEANSNQEKKQNLLHPVLQMVGHGYLLLEVNLTLGKTKDLCCWNQ